MVPEGRVTAIGRDFDAPVGKGRGHHEGLPPLKPGKRGRSRRHPGHNLAAAAMEIQGGSPGIPPPYRCGANEQHGGKGRQAPQGEAENIRKLPHRGQRRIGVNLFLGRGLNEVESPIPLAPVASERKETGGICG